MDFDIEEEEAQLDGTCPVCGREYDEVDYEYQICHRCNHVNQNHTNLTE